MQCVVQYNKKTTYSKKTVFMSFLKLYYATRQKDVDGGNNLPSSGGKYRRPSLCEDLLSHYISQLVLMKMEHGRGLYPSV